VTVGGVFSGIGGLELGLERAGMQCRWQVENHEYALKVLEKHWPNVKRYTDVCAVRGCELERVDLMCGGFPCQDISLASATGVGIIGDRSGLWKEFARLVGEVRPRFIVAENVPALRNRGLAMVLQDLWALGFDAEWHCIPASAFGAPHERDRIWIVAYPVGMFREAIIWGEPDGIIQGVSDFGWAGDFAYSDGSRQLQPEGLEPAEWGWFSDGFEAEADADAMRQGRGATGSIRPGEADGARPLRESSGSGLLRGENADPDSEPLVRAAIARGERHPWTVEPGVVRMVHGVSRRVDRLGRLGNTVVPQIPEYIGRRILSAVAALEAAA
jgi:DNA (cytosine-5)-methyltransferase 1